MSVFVFVIFIVLSVIGLCDVFHYIYMLMLRSNDCGPKILICGLNSKSPELDLKYVIEQQEWYGNKFADKIIVVTDGQNNHSSLEVCKAIAERKNIIIASKDKLVEYISAEL